ncbi:DJ-1/PfpI family protein [Alteromonas aestuariivivens]|uniref:DJ-1/PfpI family protein n=1 Tax=Alteromonas aestuariivivens TaxID=1938339 RepID=A0A3D8MBG7_9ALTE|nr:DJ-1/PfpI family protein [Alteromonas aestuariivivens]RDV27481.1 DJ-1/PfpI family protein [Alteromonas aestuariivivens]
MHIGIYIYDNAEVLDFSGPFEVFSTAKRLGAPHWQVSLISQAGKCVSARGGFNVTPHFGFHDHPELDVIIVAGGVHEAELLKPDVMHWLQSQNRSTRITASVCTGAFLLAEAGFLDDLKVTTHWEDQAQLQRQFPRLNVVANQSWVSAGKFVTSGGISAGIDMSLYLVSRLVSDELAAATARQMEYRWNHRPALSAP